MSGKQQDEENGGSGGGGVKDLSVKLLEQQQPQDGDNQQRGKSKKRGVKM